MLHNPAIGYPGLKAVIQYMEANKRIEQVRRCPSLKFIDKVTPMSLDFLFLRDSWFTINQTSYFMGVTRRFPKGVTIPKQFERDNIDYGVDHDLDEFGRADRSGDKILLPGDVVLESVYVAHAERTDEEEDLYMEGRKTRLAELKGLRRMKQRQKEKERIEAQLYTWEIRKQGGPTPFKMYLQYSKKDKDGTKTYEYLRYNKKMHEAMKYLYNSFFAGRDHPIKVRNVKFSAAGGILRLPESLKIRTQIVYIGSNVEAMFKCIGPLLVEGVKIKEIGIHAGISLLWNHEHPIVKSAHALVICSTKVTGDNFDIILNAVNPRLCVQNGKNTKEEYITLIDRIINNKKAIGTCYSFGVHSRETVKQVLDYVKDREGVTTTKMNQRGCPRFPDVYVLPVTEPSKLSVYCDQLKSYNDKTRTREPWILWMYVEQIYKPVAVKAVEVKPVAGKSVCKA